MHRTSILSFFLPTLLLPASMVGCVTPEEGIDDTTLDGTVEIPPSAEAIVDDLPDTPGPGQPARDSFETAFGLGTLSYRWQEVRSDLREFGENGDEDWFTFSPVGAGAFTVRLEYGTAASFVAGGTTTKTDTGDTGTTDTATTPDTATDTATTSDTAGDTAGDTATTPDTGTDTAGDSGPTIDTAPPPEGVGITVYIYDAADLLTYTTPSGESGSYFPDGSHIASGSSVGDGGVLDIVLAAETYDESSGVLKVGLEAGGEYYIQVVGEYDTTEAGNNYSLWLSGSDPNEAELLIGAYEVFNGDFSARGNPVAGSTIREWELDSETLTWTGIYSMLYVRTVSGDADLEYPVEIGLTEVELAATDANTVNSGLLGGTFYSDDTVIVQLQPDKANTAGEAVIMDAFAEAAAGWTQEEIEPNDVAIDLASYNIVFTDTSAAQELPIASGVGFIDTIVGSLEYSSVDPAWEGSDHDVFAITVPETMGAVITASWPNAEVNADLHLYDENGEWWGFGWSEGGDVNPEFLTTAFWGVTLEPGSTWYVGLHPYFGPEGSHEYEIRLEWVGI